MKLKEYLRGKLTEDEISLVKKSFDIIGDIAIIEIPEELENKDKIIGEAICATNKNVKTVLKKDGIHCGPYRTQKLKFVWGEDKRETVYRENSIGLKLNPEEVYFSPRLSTERQRLLQDLPPKRILVMFSGVGPYSLVAYNYQPNHKRVVSVELNPVAHKYALENLRLNRSIARRTLLYKRVMSLIKKLNIRVRESIIVDIINSLKIIFVNGDVKKEIYKFSLRKWDNYGALIPIDDLNLNCKVENKVIEITELNDVNFMKFFFLSQRNSFVYSGYIFETSLEKSYLLNLFEGLDLEGIEKYDEIFMPLPKDASSFLEEAFYVADRGAVVHMYDFVHESEIPDVTVNKVKNLANSLNVDIDIISVRKVGQYSPRKYRVCCDFIIG